MTLANAGQNWNYFLEYDQLQQQQCCWTLLYSMIWKQPVASPGLDWGAPCPEVSE